MRKFYIYARISHQDQETGDSVAGQKQRGQHYWQDHFEAQGVEWGGMFEEPGHVSANSVPFMRRKAGKEAIQKLQAGDVLYVDKVDRLWRDIHDFSDLLRWFKNHEILLVFGNLLGGSFAMDSPLGEFMLPLMVLLAQLESRQTSDRIKADFAYQKANGFFPHRIEAAPMGTKAVAAIPYVPTKSKKPKKMLVWDFEMRLIMAEIVAMRDTQGLTFRQISDAIEQKTQRYMPKFVHARRWPELTCVYAYLLEKQYYLIQVPRYMNIKALPTRSDAVVFLKNSGAQQKRA